MRIITLAILLCAFSSDVWAQSSGSNEGPRVSAHFALAFAGDAETSSILGSIDVPLAPTLGAGVRFEYPVLKYLGIGALVELVSFNPEDLDRQAALDLDILIKGRYPLSLGSSELVLYVAVPLGGTVLFVEDADNYRGFNMGILGGAELVLGGGPLSLFAEFGWRYHGVGDDDVSLRTHQAALNLGASLIL
ncbi:MAG: hypothetical protein AB8H86_02000 [Polyangiales bacterium]